MSMHDRYYEPEDDGDDDIDDWVSDWIKFESRNGGKIDPKSENNFAEAVGELALREDIAQWEDCTEAEKIQITEYWLNMGEKLGTDAYYDRNY
jgi:hypothetical protein